MSSYIELQITGATDGPSGDTGRIERFYFPKMMF
jgi:hypothetical protein